MPSTAGPTTASTPPRSPSKLGRILHNYRFLLVILTGVVIGAIIGLVFGEKATVIKPFGTLFINMIFTLVVPLVFFSISSAVAGMSSAKRLGTILGNMLGIFAVIVGIATSKIGDMGKSFAQFLHSGSEVFLKFTSIIMYYAPIGLGAYFAALIGELGAQLVGDYGRDFFTPGNVLIGIAVALLAGIPSGGFIGELMIIILYGFPAAARPIIQIIGTVNAVGDQASSTMVARILDGKELCDYVDSATALQ